MAIAIKFSDRQNINLKNLELLLNLELFPHTRVSFRRCKGWRQAAKLASTE